MKIFKPSELHSFLKERGMHAKRGLSQNFLIDGNIVQKILDTACISSGDLVLEIGPGPGALTEAMLERGASVIAIEMDKSFAKELQRMQTQDHRLEIICEDVLNLPLPEFLKSRRNKYKVVANLPYHITTPILTLLLPLHHFIESLTIMVQKEFAQRMTAKKKAADYSSFTLFLQFYAKVVKSFNVSPNCFFPKPSIHSTVVHCQLHPPLIKAKSEDFFTLTRTAFGKRRKMLRVSLKNLYDVTVIEKGLIALGHSANARPEELSIEEFIDFFNFLNNPA